MAKFGKIFLGLCLFVTGCTSEFVDVFSFSEEAPAEVVAADNVAVTTEDKCLALPKEYENVGIAIMTRSGVKVCPNNRKCTNEALLPPRPCDQPMPTYYDNVSELMTNEGVLLIHPYTRTKVLCLDQEGLEAVRCAEMFRAEGYVLITDVPQFAGKYDVLGKGGYPTRRWRDGENIPRW